MNELSTVRLGDVCKTNTSSYSSRDGWMFVNYLDTGNITENKVDTVQRIDLANEKLPSRAKRKVKYNSIIYSTVRPVQRHYGIIKSAPENFLVSTGFTVIDVDEKTLDADYLYYLLIQDEVVAKLQAIAEQSTSAYPAIRPTDIEDLHFDVPSLSEQKRIANVLLSLDRSAAQNLKMNVNLESQVYAIYKAWFEDLVLTGGQVPQNWRTAKLGDIASITSGKRPPIKSSEKTDEASIPLVGAASVMGYTSEANHSDRILVTGRVGTHGVVQRFNIPCWTSDNTLVITSKYYEFTSQVLRRVDYQAINRGSTQPLITQGDLSKTPIILPDKETLDRFETVAGALMAQADCNDRENVSLRNIRDSILPRILRNEMFV